MRSSCGSVDSGNGTTTAPSSSPRDRGSSGGDGDVRLSMDAIPPHVRHTISTVSNSADEMQDSASITSLPNDKRGYKLSHTVPAETWEKAITAVEQQGMSLRAAAKLYDVHFAALHRRVKKRAQSGQAKGNNGYFHPSDEASIMRVVVARAELGVLMTFDELMRLVEAAALRKLPNISIDSARKLLTRFQSRNENSIRHIIVDWPPPRPSKGASQQYQPYLEHPGFDFGSDPPDITRSMAAGATTNAATAEAMTATAQNSLFVPPSRLPSCIHSQRNEPSQLDVGAVDGSGVAAENNSSLPNDQLRSVGHHARFEGDRDIMMIV
ncbi:unnamed protein product [Phytophthora fragariaefolia]|uniref:Unnamed protein product n=1 Tax=Phytophthora fragariaefolia TaxID=1490495 RepID=A0A9W6X3N6_9STRA|nr:unnamed protein product [Phytophthora fragariaefolia]